MRRLREPIKAIAALLLLTGACGDLELPSEDGDENETGIAIEVLAPASGPVSGATTITLVGGDFVAGDTRVTLGGREAIDVEVVDRQTLVFRSPAADAPGPVAVSVFNSNGFAARSDAFTYQPPIELTGVTPAIGRVSGGEIVTLTGAGFKDTSPGPVTVTFAGQALSAEVVDDSTLTVVAPKGEAWTSSDVAVSSRNGQATLARGYTYMLPGLLSISLSSGSLLHIDPVTGSSTRIRSGESNGGTTALAISKDGQIFAAHRQHDALNGNHVARISVSDDEFEEIVAVSAQRIGGMDITQNNNLLVAMRQDSSGVTQFDLTTKTITGVIPFPEAMGTSCRGCALAQQSSGEIFGAFSGTTGRLFRVNAGAFEAATTLLGVTDENIRAMTFAGQTLFAIRRGAGDAAPGGGSNETSTLTRINPTTGVLTDIATFSDRLDGLAAIPLAPAN